MNSAVPEERLSEGVMFIGVRNLYNEGMFRLAAGYAASHNMLLLDMGKETDSNIIPPSRISLMVCSPPCWAGAPAWLAALLVASRYRAERVLVYLDKRYLSLERQVRQLFHSYIGVVSGQDSLARVVEMLQRPPPVLAQIHSSPCLNKKELAVLCGYLQGIPVKVQARALGLSDKSIYRIRQHGLNKLGLRPWVLPHHNRH